jgi:hypothetical protein
MKISQKFALLRSVSRLSLAPSSQDANYDLASCKAFELEEGLLNHDYGCNESSHIWILALFVHGVAKGLLTDIKTFIWFLCGLQIAETCEAGASAITAVYSVLSKGTPAILNFAMSLGLDAIVEVVNVKELQEVASLGLPIYGFNLSVGLAVC